MYECFVRAARFAPQWLASSFALDSAAAARRPSLALGSGQWQRWQQLRLLNDRNKGMLGYAAANKLARLRPGLLVSYCR